MFGMLANILKNAGSRPATRPYPASPREPFPATRGELVNEVDRCIFCGACERACPSACIDVDKDKGLWQHDPFECVYCGVCVDVCPVSCLSQLGSHVPSATARRRNVLCGTPLKKKRAEKKK